MTKYLVENGADINAKDAGGRTALSIAEEKEHMDIIEYLKIHGAK